MDDKTKSHAELLQELDRAKGLLREAGQEIRNLRQTLGYVQPKAKAYDLVVRIAAYLPHPPQGYGVDVAWQIDNFLNPSTDFAGATVLDEGEAPEAGPQPLA